MHRATPANTSNRAYNSGGARSVVDKANDGTLMQEMSGSFMSTSGGSSESRKKIEAPQNYGFTSVVMPADKDKEGKVTGGAETFMSFIGGNRGFPVAGNMDDRRHRLKGLDPGDSAMYRTKDDDQQFHMTKDGGFWSAPEGKTVRMQLVPEGSGKAESKQDSGGSGGGTGQQKEQDKKKPTGQKAVASEGKESVYHVEVKKDMTTAGGNRVQLKLSDKKGYVDTVSKSVYLGYPKGEAEFAKVMTLSGPAKNVFGRIG